MCFYIKRGYMPTFLAKRLQYIYDSLLDVYTLKNNYIFKNNPF